MKTTLAELHGVKGAWERLMSARASEMDFASIGFDGLTGDIIKDAIDRLLEIVEAHEKKARVVEKEDITVTDAGAARALREARSWIDSAQGNGTSWLLNSTDFLSRLSLVASTLRQSIGRNVDLRARLARLAADQVHSDLTLVQTAAVAAKNVLEKSKIVDESESRVSMLQGEMESARNAVATALDETRESATDLASKKEEISRILEDIKKSKDDVDGIKSASEEDASKLRSSLEELTDSIESSVKKSNSAITQLDVALRDARRQGLAKAFYERYKAARFEYIVWMVAFFAAIGALAWLGKMQLDSFTAQGISTAAQKDTDQELMKSQPVLVKETDLFSVLRRLLAELPLAVPLIWLGWYSAKRIGVASRLMQDYEYKAATALAFESYKNEVQVLGGGELSAQLLATAIKNFADNPVRLLGPNEKNHGHPMESLVDALKDEKISERFLKVLELFRK